MNRHEVADMLIDLLGTRGGGAYFGEGVSETAHMLQAAAGVARRRPDDAATIVAALLHDVGHLLHNLGEDVAERGIDSRHEQVGAGWLARWFGPEVTEPVRLHVDAKRCLCAAEPRYLAGLSPASVRSLALQGGPMSAGEAERFAALPHAEAAVLLRRCDDAGKDPGLAVPGLDHYREAVAAALRP
jgi:gamma-butyrobetaine dioxygenase